MGQGIFGLLGPNGAGKTTLLRVLLGLLEPDYGRARVLGYSCSSQSLQVRRRTGYLGEDQRFYEYMKGEEYLKFIGGSKGLGRGELGTQVSELVEKLGLSGAGEKKIKEYSQGMKQRLELAQVLIGSPELVILDEPTSNLDPIGRQEFLETIREVGSSATVVLSSHILGEVEEVCSSLAFLNLGEVVYRGEWSELKERFPGKSLQEIFVGVVGGGKVE